MCSWKLDPIFGCFGAMYLGGFKSVGHEHTLVIFLASDIVQADNEVFLTPTLSRHVFNNMLRDKFKS